ncbi:DUF1802 family protein [Paenibacillus thalictri]|uniref:DUF1802 family protein n=1 Tax=Paenibacillus thalictri TaxID=2527873 RepID=A0A4Q9DMY1_9BACL|nr:DUF1802 family protein [Paenibacillus thalictri]TBL75100.1 DUF1802 family protein [Paenibacillus thalictri]
MTIHPIALKEWAVAVDALKQGRQILIMRKGGIREETKHFQIESSRFFLFPTFEHQRKELIKPEYQDMLDGTLSGWNPQQTTVTIDTFAELALDIEVSEQPELDKLAPFHIWTDHFAEERLKWKRKNPLHIMLLRVYSLNHPATLPIVDSYNGCRSWIQLEAELSDLDKRPVLDDAAFAREADKIKMILGIKT